QILRAAVDSDQKRISSIRIKLFSRFGTLYASSRRLPASLSKGAKEKMAWGSLWMINRTIALHRNHFPSNRTILIVTHFPFFTKKTTLKLRSSRLCLCLLLLLLDCFQSSFHFILRQLMFFYV